MTVWDVYARCYDVIGRLEPYRRMLREVIDEVPAAPGRVLDAGCGTGNLTRALLDARPGTAEVVAVDLSAAMLARARRKNPRATHIRADLTGVTGEFDVILCGNVLYTLDDPGRAMAVLKKRLAPGGRLIVTTPRAGAGTGRILRDHVRARGWLSLLPALVPLLVVGVINARLLRTAAYHFVTREQLRGLLGDADIRPTYSDQAWLAVVTAPGRPSAPTPAP